MDDLNLEGPKLTPQQEKTLKRLQQMANDRIRVYNPTDEDYIIVWDRAGAGGGFLVPSKSKDIGYGKGQAVHPRYIARKYVYEMTDKILGGYQRQMIDSENARRVASGNARMNKHEEELQFASTPNINPADPDRRKKLFSILWVGIEEQYGAEVQVIGDEIIKRDPRSADDQILSEMETKRAQPVSVAPSLDSVLSPLQPENPPVSPFIPVKPQQPVAGVNIPNPVDPLEGIAEPVQPQAASNPLDIPAPEVVVPPQGHDGDAENDDISIPELDSQPAENFNQSEQVGVIQ